MLHDNLHEDATEFVATQGRKNFLVLTSRSSKSVGDSGSDAGFPLTAAPLNKA